MRTAKLGYLGLLLGWGAWFGAAQFSPAHGQVNVSTANGQTTINWKGKPVFTGPTQGPVRCRSENNNGEEYAAAFDGDKVLWENTPGAAQKMKRPALGALANGAVRAGGAGGAGGGGAGGRGAGAAGVPGAAGGGQARAFVFGGAERRGDLLAFNQPFNGAGANNVSARTVNGQTTVMLNGQVVYSGPAKGNVSVRSRTIDGITYTLVQDGDHVLWDSSKPLDEFALTANPGPVLPAGIYRTDGRRVPASIVSVDEAKVFFRRAGQAEESLPLAEVAVLLFNPMPHAKRKALLRDDPGLLLRDGDYVEGELKSLAEGQVGISSVLLGLKTYPIDPEVMALVLRKASL